LERIKALDSRPAILPRNDHVKQKGENETIFSVVSRNGQNKPLGRKKLVASLQGLIKRADHAKTLWPRGYSKSKWSAGYDTRQKIVTIGQHYQKIGDTQLRSQLKRNGK